MPHYYASKTALLNVTLSLAVELAGEVRDRHPDGVWFIDLAPETDGAPDSVLSFPGKVLADAAGGRLFGGQ